MWLNETNENKWEKTNARENRLSLNTKKKAKTDHKNLSLMEGFYKKPTTKVIKICGRKSCGSFSKTDHKWSVFFKYVYIFKIHYYFIKVRKNNFREKKIYHM